LMAYTENYFLKKIFQLGSFVLNLDIVSFQIQPGKDAILG